MRPILNSISASQEKSISFVPHFMIETGKDIRAKIESTLDLIRPYLKADGGDVEFVDVSSEMIIQLRLLGTCSTCTMSRFTMKAGIEESLIKAIPSIKSVVAV